MDTLIQRLRERGDPDSLEAAERLENRTAHKLGYVKDGELTVSGLEHLRAMLPAGWELRLM